MLLMSSLLIPSVSASLRLCCIHALPLTQYFVTFVVDSLLHISKIHPLLVPQLQCIGLERATGLELSSFVKLPFGKSFCTIYAVCCRLVSRGPYCDYHILVDNDRRKYTVVVAIFRVSTYST